MSERSDLDSTHEMVPDVSSYQDSPGYTIIVAPDGSTTSFTYDEACRGAQAFTETPPWLDLSNGAEFRYDAWGRLLELETPDGITTYTYHETPASEIDTTEEKPDATR